MKIRNVAKLVENELEENVDARRDDMYLYTCIAKAIVGEKVIKKPFDFVMKYHILLGLPNYETVRRTRARIQSQRPELRDKITEEIRLEREREFYEYVTE